MLENKFSNFFEKSSETSEGDFFNSYCKGGIFPMNSVEPGSLLCPKQKSEPVTYLFTGNSNNIVLGRLAKCYQKPKRLLHKTQRKYIPPTSYQEKMARPTETQTINRPSFYDSPTLTLRTANHHGASSSIKQKLNDNSCQK